ncbi:hypothetical protein O3P69_014634 [Scylla paramamosain]|uniref:Pro-resilin n=1 Tax=Scylla paramamosain TaxID=85552 RepID=A0AAW0TX90_SCYPA
MTLKVVLLSALLAATFARPDTLRPSYGAPAPSYSAPAPEAPPKYDYNYAVKDEYSGNDFGAQEARDGYDTQGSYYVQLPDGRLQKVTYTVNGDSGFVAEVTYEGEAQYPQQSYAPAPAPSYGPRPGPLLQASTHPTSLPVNTPHEALRQASSAGRECERKAGEEQASSFSTGRPLSARGSPDVTEGRPVTV